MVLDIHEHGQCLLALTVDAVGAPAIFFGFGQDRNQQRRQNRNNRNDHQQLNQGERTLGSPFGKSSVCKHGRTIYSSPS